VDLKAFLKSMTRSDRSAFAERCRISAGHLHNVAYGTRPCGTELAIAIDRESGGRVSCEELRPDVDWAYLRGGKSSLLTTMRRGG
jgi:DNA-binding transcriptional regulator YdaS (Cro superfamily)